MVFGKLPAHGDFVARGLGAAERERLDRWLSASMLDAQAALGDDFADRFDRALPWRFALRGESGWTAGAITPSMDAAGRRFPLLAGRSQVAEDRAAGIAAETETLLYRALGGGWDADATAAALDALAPAELPGAVSEGWWSEGNGADTVRCDEAWPPTLARHMLAAVPA